MGKEAGKKQENPVGELAPLKSPIIFFFFFFFHFFLGYSTVVFVVLNQFNIKKSFFLFVCSLQVFFSTVILSFSRDLITFLNFEGTKLPHNQYKLLHYLKDYFSKTCLHKAFSISLYLCLSYLFQHSPLSPLNFIRFLLPLAEALAMQQLYFKFSFSPLLKGDAEPIMGSIVLNFIFWLMY